MGAICVGLFSLLSAFGTALRRLACCWAPPAETWSPLFVHPGYVFFSELGRNIQPSDEPASLVPDNVHMWAGIVANSTAAKKKIPNKSWTQQYESEQRKDGVV